MAQRGSTGPRVVHEDRDILVVDKPAGLLTIGTARQRTRTLHAQLCARVGGARSRDRVFIVHRLDRDASGLLVFARTPEAKLALQEQFRLRVAGRVYLALVHGCVQGDEHTYRSNLAENAALKVYSTREPSKGKPAITHVRVRQRSERATLIEARLETGRKHQIRVHLAEAGHPIVGDRRYGPDKPASRRLALHAVELRFRHPRTGQEVQFRSALPPGFPPLREAAGRRVDREQSVAVVESPGRSSTRPRARPPSRGKVTSRVGPRTPARRKRG